MTDLIDSLIAAALGPILSLVEKIRSTLGTFWNVFIAFFRLIRNVWATFRATIVNTVTSIVTHALAVLTTLRWIITVLVPRAIGIAVDRITTFINQQIALVRAFASTAIADLRSWASTGLALLSSFLANLRSWTIAQISGIVSTLSTIGSFVWGTLGTPERLVAWAGEAIASWLIGYVRRNAQRFMTLAWNARGALYAAFIHLLEDFLHTIL